jgi:hypothetical protein
MKKQCSDRDQLLVRIEELESQVQRFEDTLLEGYLHSETDEQLLGRIEALTVMMILIKIELYLYDQLSLQEELDVNHVIIVSAVKELDSKTKMLADAVKT